MARLTEKNILIKSLEKEKALKLSDLLLLPPTCQCDQIWQNFATLATF